ncbi:hypothetical protein [Clostridium sp.]|uniref:hypothetical protein n=1 Tax=Clostridium sp. TaxID=1506 RepID=UPI00290087FE|nr:hypothetical protein [Clostridium sp.]MDU2282264.1 hypothetical protein [Clostridium sp.]
MYTVDYSILCHSPAILSKDCISLAILFFNRDTKDTILIPTKKWDRVRTFNDELNIDLIKLQLDGIEDEIHDIAKAPDFTLNKYTKFFVNDLKFSEVISTSVEDFNSFVKECSRQYLRSDYKKEDRPSLNEQISFIKKYLKTEEIPCEKNVIRGYFNENVVFDFIIGEYAFKLFRFEGRKENRLIRHVKDWAYDAIKLKDKYKIIFITDLDFQDREKYKTVYSILEEDSHLIISFDQAISYIQSIYKKSNIS